MSNRKASFVHSTVPHAPPCSRSLTPHRSKSRSSLRSAVYAAVFLDEITLRLNSIGFSLSASFKILSSPAVYSVKPIRVNKFVLGCVASLSRNSTCKETVSMMKKFFFFKSSVSTEVNNISAPSTSSKDKQVYLENSANEGLKYQAVHKSKAKNLASESHISGTSPSLRRSRSYSTGIGHELALQRTQSGSPCSTIKNDLFRQSDCRSRHTLTPERHSREKWFEDAALYNAHGSEVFEGRTDKDSSESSSNASTNVLDRYIDGEHSRGNIGNANGNGGGKRPPRVQYIGPASPKDGPKQKPKSHSFREPNKSCHYYNSSREWIENGFGNESPRKLAKQVVERLSQSRALPRISSSDFDPDIPITIEDIYGGSSRKCASFHSDGVPKDISSFEERGCFAGDDDYRVSEYVESEEGLDQTDEGNLVNDELKLVKTEFESERRKLDKEKNEMQVALEKELDRRSSEWSLKLEKYQSEEHRLRERVRELAEQNVSLQREISTFSEKEKEIQDLNSRIEKETKENQILQDNVYELQEKYRAADEDREIFCRNYEDKETQCKELHKAVARMLRTCSEQEKTIEGLREGLSKEEKKISDNDQFLKFQVEHVRLTGVEQSLRKEVESCRLEVDFLRHENINLLHRLEEISKDGDFSTFKLDQELLERVHCLKNQGLSLLNESNELCTKLVENIRKRPGQTSESKQSIERIRDGLDGQFFIESDMKLQGLKRGAENIGRSLQTVSKVLHEKSRSKEDESTPVNSQNSEDRVKSDLKAETLVTSLLREKLYTKELDLDQLRAELGAAVRGNDVLRYELQNALDSLSCANHKMKDLELQMIKKDDNTYRIQNELQECRKELSMVKGILPKVSEERDMMWEEVKQYSESNMLLTSEVGLLKKKIETLDEDVLLKEGQITILRDALGKPFDLLASPGEFRLN